MELQNNLENKARFFAQYYGIEVLKSDFDDFKEKNAVLAVNFEYSNVIKSGYLELTPLSKISDEDAIEVSKLLGYITKRTIVRDTDCISIFLYTEDDCDVQPTFNIQYDGYAYFNNGDTWEDNFQRGADVSAYDYLRSKGYALPFHDLSVEDLINYGWIRLKNNGSQPNPKQ